MNKDKVKLISLSSEISMKDMILKAKIWRDIYYHTAAKISAFLSLLFMAMMIYLNSNNNANVLLLDLIPTMIGGMIGLIAFSLSAIAIVTSTISDKFLYTTLQNGRAKSIDDSKTFQKIKILMYTFYFSAMVNLVSTVLLIISLFALYIEVPDDFRTFSLPIISFITSYVVLFSLIYSLYLMGICIKIRFLTVDDE